MLFNIFQLKPHIAIDHNFFGGKDGFQGFIDTNTAHNCPKPVSVSLSSIIFSSYIFFMKVILYALIFIFCSYVFL